MNNLSRKKFLFSGLSLAAVITFFKWKSIPEKKKTATAKFLTQDGKLVEIDIEKLPLSKKVIASKEDVQNWVKK
ncbi:hypothetical protein [Solitalea canadensis]|uniref:Uncharacterized protein n=1 Tax=Solitalea canadensis (strain ATCC 29591 / DSM 3403 / JCM 21819 / LMG 8368 / NBRC 15130 / NCIMB 12057 / USAM 9D) TaxID=929556 RepID=H8KR69_SOLCM|nr:hypothetical protein [Solitalea canadensis]AFD07275.1 hypothetical protein Solca_2232 [Solitalea canadensis DSM 3403]